jgi:hypothetical protein
LNVTRDNSGLIGKAGGRGRRINKRTSKRRGELAELTFLLKAASLGFAVANPYGDGGYDFIVDSGTRLFRVPVKSASRLWQGAYFITTQRCCNGVAIPYTAAEIDFLAAYVFPEDAWFVVPVGEFSTKTSIRVFPRERGEHGMYAEHREAWCQMACGREGVSAAGVTIERRCPSGRPNNGTLPDACPLRTRPAIKRLAVP